jgi:site-specific DNA recombinase
VDNSPAPDYVAYLRKSVGRKAERQQRTLTRAHVERQGGRIIAEFRDDDQTAFRKIDGSQPVRDGFTAMLAMLRANPGLRVAAYHADRLTRNDEDTAELIRVCAAGGHLVETAAGGVYDLSTANGRRRLRDDASAAIYEVDRLTERVLAGRAEVAAEGRWLGGKRPFGWERDRAPVGSDGQPLLDEDGEPVRGILRLVPAEADALARACADVIEGAATLAGIARRWNAAGILSTGGAQWRANEVGRVLRRPRNAGLMEHQGQITGAAQWPPIVNEETWKAVVAVLSQPGRKTTPGPAPRHLLSFLARCGVCDGPVICTATSRAAANGRERKSVYRCREGEQGTRKEQRHVGRDQAQLDQLIERVVIGRLSLPNAADLLTVDQGETVRRELAVLRTETAAVQALMRDSYQLHRDGLLSTSEFADGRREHQARITRIETRMSELERADVIAPLLRDPTGIWAGLSMDEQRQVVGALMTVRLMPAARKGRPPGWRPGQPYFDPDSVEISWRRKLPGEG